MDLSYVEPIRRAPRERLLDARFLESELLPRLGVDDSAPGHFPDSLRATAGYGLLYHQHPNQFSRYLVELAHRPVESYLEIGVWHGGTFVVTVEYLSRFRPLRRAVAADIDLNPGIRRYARRHPAVLNAEMDSHSEEFRAFLEENGPFDLVLIDADHSEAACRRDFETVVDHARLVAFHDIVHDDFPGVARVWRWVKEEYGDRFEFLEFVDQYPELLRRRGGRSLMGIGLAVPAPRSAPRR